MMGIEPILAEYKARRGGQLSDLGARLRGGSFNSGTAA